MAGARGDWSLVMHGRDPDLLVLAASVERAFCAFHSVHSLCRPSSPHRIEPIVAGMGPNSRCDMALLDVI